jgi:hypothetical protein
LLSAIWLNHDSKKKHVLMATAYTAYFDASGQPGDSPVVFVCGFVSTAKKWLRFESQWNALLKKAGIASPLHMTDFVNGAPPYKTWKEDTGEKRTFFQRAIKVIKTNTNKSFALGVEFKNLVRASQTYDMPLLEVPAYVWCAMGVTRFVITWAKRQDVPLKDIEFVFEKGDRHQHIFEDHCFKKWGIIPIIKLKGSLASFQAADALAWEMRRSYMDHLRQTPIRQSAYAMYDQFPNKDSWGMYTWQHIERLSQKWAERQGK